MRYAVVVPTYNESKNLPVLLERLSSLTPKPDVLVVDDDSPDGTGAIADAIAERDPGIRVLHRVGPRGYAASSVDGLLWALEAGYDLVCSMDADLSHDPASLPAIVSAAQQGSDVVIGSRYVAGGALEVDWGPVRKAVSRAGSAYARTMLGVPVRDCTSGFRCYTPATLRAVDLRTIRSDGYCFLIEVLDRARRAGLRVEEVPIRYVDRQMGDSKISRRIVFEALARTTGLGLRRLIGR